MLLSKTTLLSLLVGIAVALGCSRQEAPPEVFRVGLLAPLTNHTRFTAHLLAQARVEEVNAAGGLDLGGRKVLVKLIVADTGGQTEHTMSEVARLVQQEHVSAFLGPYYSREAVPVGAALERLRVPMLTPAATNPNVTLGRKFSFRMCQVDSAQGRSMARYAYDQLGLRSVAVLFNEGDDYSSGLAEYFRQEFASRPGATVLVQGYSSGQDDFKPQLQRIAAAGSQGLFLPSFEPELGWQLSQARAAGFRGVFLGGDSWDTDVGFHTLPEAQGAYFSTDFSAEAADQARLRSALALAEKVGEALGKNSALTLDALDALFAAARAVGGTDPVTLRSGLANLGEFNGLTGRIVFSGGGDPERSVFIMGITGGKAHLRTSLIGG